MSNWSYVNMQDATSPLMEQLMFFHDHTLIILIIITSIVTYMMTFIMFNNIVNRLLLEGQLIEFFWTLLPALTLIFIAFPSLRLLYLLDEINKPLLTLKIIGHQWYWSYEYSDFLNIEFDSYMKPQNEMLISEFRLLEVDNRTVLPFNTQIRLLISSFDVIHSWAMPSMSIKVDAVPGRLNQASMFMNRPGMSFGQCSEICGANHSFMPIVIESVDVNCFINWLVNY
uniref:Cytochrome c oxidase subunit 2 n=1 Tax=Magicicada tredecim TaxID=52805 RepID=A0A088DP88_9HEMI|nr:cytochrome c oxidase subunit II [Magicicada tredecim]AIM19525.1 cytochrome c oxidase subunit II [Magicicada tredecim]AWV83538.1 cytochrome oxidase subunit II [Magicicada tredecim]AWV83551.1 cytochrome oxidase subunit II [Magicicada tredecim]AWV83564.1 cytochrome oxidase subunit II [Magicicada tredecim]AWV83577.1 cytochrome oxidase subunit II [Magicicada tredecim]